MPAPPAAASHASTILDIASAVCGIGGTYLMSRRYTTSIGGFLFVALIAPFMFVFGSGRKLHDYIEKRTLTNRDVPVATNRMALGLALLCWAFFFQLVKVLLS